MQPVALSHIFSPESSPRSRQSCRNSVDGIAARFFFYLCRAFWFRLLSAILWIAHGEDGRRGAHTTLWGSRTSATVISSPGYRHLDHGARSREGGREVGTEGGTDPRTVSAPVSGDARGEPRPSRRSACDRAVFARRCNRTREHHDHAALHERTGELARRIDAAGARAARRARRHDRRRTDSGGVK